MVPRGYIIFVDAFPFACDGVDDLCVPFWLLFAKWQMLFNVAACLKAALRKVEERSTVGGTTSDENLDLLFRGALPVKRFVQHSPPIIDMCHLISINQLY